MGDSLRGLKAVETLFRRTQEEGRAAFLPYYPMGYPDWDTSLEVIQSLAAVGADGLELGIPFSDPLADGPILQAATQRALAQGTTVKRCLEGVRILRERGVTQPLFLMGYLNPLLAYGISDFVRDATHVGADAFIVPDLPLEEWSLLGDPASRHERGLVGFVAPNTSDERMQRTAHQSTGFLYVLSVTGVTGARDTWSEALEPLTSRLRSLTKQPLVVGFGISRPSQVHRVRTLFDGYIVGSALVAEMNRGPEALSALAREFVAAQKAR